MEGILGTIVLVGIIFYGVYTAIETFATAREVRNISKDPPKKPNLGSDGILGKIGILDSDIDLDKTSTEFEGRVHIDGESWSAKVINPSNLTLNEGRKVVVKEIQGLTLVVEPCNDR